jgi:2,5-diketo-D-gluconate reductase A
LIGSGRLRSVGVSNFQPAHLDRIVSATGVVPAVNQIEVHRYFRNDAARAASARHRVMIEAWSPLGQGTVLQDCVIAAIGRTSGKSVAQVVLRWHIQHGHAIFPKSNHEVRMRENLDIFDFVLSTGEMARIVALDRGEVGRIGPNPDTFAWIP